MKNEEWDQLLSLVERFHVARFHDLAWIEARLDEMKAIIEHARAEGRVAPRER